MPTKSTKAGREYEVDAKKLTWTPLEGSVVEIPLRMKTGLLRKIAGIDINSADGAIIILDELIPGQADAIDELDVMLDLMPMFETWFAEYQALSGASLGESSGSSI